MQVTKWWNNSFHVSFVARGFNLWCYSRHISSYTQLMVSYELSTRQIPESFRRQNTFSHGPITSAFYQVPPLTIASYHCDCASHRRCYTTATTATIDLNFMPQIRTNPNQRSPNPITSLSPTPLLKTTTSVI
ncbi:Uncharacterized protein Fot_35256 [Forsythia ovata]|uniref:Uncharacterized protein n=1 Tax=Forsythia ovata TaxID=205694 RepID=A0ABD1SL10_9LAMI